VRLAANAAEVGRLLDQLGQPGDRVWPGDRWPPMRLETPPAPGVRGAHGPVAYVVDAYTPGRLLSFRFTAPAGFVGGHRFEVEPAGEGATFTHRLTITPVGAARLLWPIVFRPLHDALAAEAIARARAAVGEPAEAPPWGPWVRMLRGFR
jgi:hypothetical protein